MKIFITGATGFIGTYVVQELVKQNHQIVCLKRESSNLQHLSHLAIEWINNNTEWQKQVIAFKPDVIFNLAWNGVSANDRTDWNVQISNIELQQQLLNISKECHSKKFIGIGSQAEYGDFECKIKENAPLNPKNAYAASKCASLTILKTFCEINNIEWYWFRVFPIFGPLENERWLIPSLIKNICTQDHMDLTPGEQKLPYLYVGECAKAIISSITASNKSGIYNISSNNPITLKELVTYIRNKINPKFNLNFGAIPYRYGQSMYMEGDTTLLRQQLYDLDTNNFEVRLNETIQYYLNLYSK